MSISRYPNPLTTQAAEGLPRRSFTVAELERMVDAGIIEEDERIELIGGEIVPMSPKGNRHEVVKSALTVYWARRLPNDLTFTTETTFRLTAHSYLEPDFVFYPKDGGLKNLTAKTAALVVEVADTSLGYDLGRKASLYAGFGIAELWVVNAITLETRVHCEPTAGNYRQIQDFGPRVKLSPQAAPGLAVTLSRIKLY